MALLLIERWLSDQTVMRCSERRSGDGILTSLVPLKAVGYA